MKYLCDTHTFLWWIFDDSRLSRRSRTLIAAAENELFLSAASGWEIATKYRIGKLPDANVLLQDLTGWMDKSRFRELPISMAHAERAGSWKVDHRDPFDRMIAAQSHIQNMPVIGNDSALEWFGIELVW